MKEILLINPGPKKKAKGRKKSKGTKTKGTKKMAKKKTRKKATRRRRSNPMPAKARRAATRVRQTFMGMNFNKAFKNIPAFQIGMFSATWAAKFLGGEMSMATQTDPESWTWASYLKGSLGSVVAGAIAQNVKPGSGQRVLEGGLNLMLYKMIQNELIVRNEWATRQFGAEEEDVFVDEYGTPYIMGEDDELLPVDERHRLPEEMEGIGDVLVPPGRLGDELEPPGRLGAADAWSRAFYRQ
jgi:hypothetical protein